MKILLVNDDGIYAPGLRALVEPLQKIGSVTVVAPLVEQSGVGHLVTYLRPITAKKVLEGGTDFGWGVDGSPADCVKLGVLEFCDGEPDLIVSGINSGANVGINVLYSGTVAAAIEGAFFGITSVALSLSQGKPPNYDNVAQRAVPLIQKLLKTVSRPGTLWNVNFPDTTPEGPRGIRMARMAVRRHTETVDKRIDPRGRPYYWSGLDPILNHELDPGTDVKELLDGWATVTPLHFDLSENSILDECQSICWDD
ncbi:5'-nucleotidase SurE [Thalassoglobus neptunius]|uniref:5'-nucleotidase SurE n=1 Tax=Thalassoglobus neptunius TaxID=1938619 RepID=A0A5C5WQ91_9PLAN|nr:5'/3'-nucleotidase SurE [Thalassoglobus neptunius]TWT52213.1 5'-nucleotidase SurE [Thalassoglobus neptunius]